MKSKFLILLAALCTGLAVLVGISSATSPANAAGCGAWRHVSSSTGQVAGDNLKVAGRPLVWRFGFDVRECDGYDEVKDVGATLSKSGIGCQAVLGYTDGYKFNPNSLAGTNAGEKWVDCIGSAGNYAVNYPAYDNVRVGRFQPENERCLNFTFTVDIQAQGDPSWNNAPSICLNGS